MADVNKVPNPANSPIEKLITVNMLDNMYPQLASKLSENPTKQEVLEAFMYHDSVIKNYIDRHNRVLGEWANIHTHSGVVGGGNPGDPVLAKGVASNGETVLSFDLSTGALTTLYGVGLTIQLLDNDKLGYYYVAAHASPGDGFVQKREEDGTFVWQYDLPDVFDIAVADNGRVALVNESGVVHMVNSNGIKISETALAVSQYGLSIEPVDGEYVYLRGDGNNVLRIPWGDTAVDFTYTQSGWEPGRSCANKQYVVAVGGRSAVTLFDQESGSVIWNNTEVAATGNEAAGGVIDDVNNCVWFISEQGYTGVNQLLRIDIASGLITDSIDLPVTDAFGSTTTQYELTEVFNNGYTLFAYNQGEITRYDDVGNGLATPTWSTATIDDKGRPGFIIS